MANTIYGYNYMNSKTPWQFDKIYHNRKEMEDNIKDDNVFVGRFVLVKYGFEVKDGDFSISQEIFNEDLNKDESFLTSNTKTTTAIDDLILKAGRGFDSTVWQKITLPIKGGTQTKYIKIANLNYIPGLTSVRYSPSNEELVPVLKFIDNPDTSDGAYYQLQYKDPWKIKIGNIEYNKNGFIEYPQAGVQTKDNSENSIGFKKIRDPNVPNGFYCDDTETEDKNDTYQLNINLPAIGNAVSKVYDLLHGQNRDDGNDSWVKMVEDAKYTMLSIQEARDDANEAKYYAEQAKKASEKAQLSTESSEILIQNTLISMERTIDILDELEDVASEFYKTIINNRYLTRDEFLNYMNNFNFVTLQEDEDGTKQFYENDQQTKENLFTNNCSNQLFYSYLNKLKEVWKNSGYSSTVFNECVANLEKIWQDGQTTEVDFYSVIDDIKQAWRDKQNNV